MLEKHDRQVLQTVLDRFLELTDGERRHLELKRQISTLLKTEGAGLTAEGLGELLVLLLFYGTHLGAGEIARLEVSQVTAVEMGRFQIRTSSGDSEKSFILPAEVSEVVKLYLRRIGRTSGPLVAHPSGRAMAETELYDVVQRTSNETLVAPLAGAGTVFRGQHVVLPTPTRMRSHPGYAGRGVTIAFVDSGFYAHPDLIRPANRIKAYIDITGQGRSLYTPMDDGWHGTMTASACAGSGWLSGGLYPGIASEAQLVLVAAGRKLKIGPADLARAIEWVVKHRDEYEIRILNVSLGTLLPLSYRESPIDEAAELAVQAGIVVVAAAGNDPLRPSTPPANSPSVLTVGGLVDKNLPYEMTYSPYLSPAGTTVDGLLKPEITAPSALVAAPMLPGTKEFEKARALWYQKSVPDDELLAEVKRRKDILDLPEGWQEKSVVDLRDLLESETRRMKLVAAHYQHVDGTSFSAPIVTSVVAQMLEANPNLSPADVRDILIETALTVPHIPRERQGYGVVQATAAVQAAESPGLRVAAPEKGTPRVSGSEVTFTWEGGNFSSVGVAGDFNGWVAVPLTRRDGGWEGTFRIQLPGTYRYKLVLNERFWVEDARNPKGEPDGFGHVNSLFEIAEHAAGESSLDEVFERRHPTRHPAGALRPPHLPERGVSARATSPPPTPEVRNALTALDYYLSLPGAARNGAVRRYWLRSLELVVERLARPAEAPLEVWQLYNCGVVVRTPSLSLGIDVVTGRHVWGVSWRVPEDLVQSLASRLDGLLVTQRLPDHLDLDVARPLLKAGRPVVVPEEVRALVAEQTIGMAAGTTRELALAGTTVEVTAHRAVHAHDEAGAVVQRAYEVALAGISVLHLADHDHTRFVDFRRSPNVVFAKLGRFGEDDEPAASLKKLVDRCQPGLLIPTHVAELGDPGHGADEGYDAASAWVEEAGVTAEILGWGEGWSFSG